jgi:hypothetical protein
MEGPRNGKIKIMDFGMWHHVAFKRVSTLQRNLQRLYFYSEGEGITFLYKVGPHLPKYAASYLRSSCLGTEVFIA